tara:strand:+ start:901 stop:1119 length:219 start_codon:yes stop_codon:yes gene_type:complete
MKVGDLVRWARFEDEYDFEDDDEYNDFGIIVSIDVWELSDPDQIILGVLFSKIGFVWCNPKSLELVSNGVKL